MACGLRDCQYRAEVKFEESLKMGNKKNLARQTESEFSVFDRTEGQQKMGNLYTINRLKKEEDEEEE